MIVFTREYIDEYKEDIFRRIMGGHVFIYPTDTIYGLGCDARNEKAVERIREMKERYDRPFSILVPSMKWILKNCEIDDRWLKKLPGPYTFILKLKNENSIAKNVNLGMETIGVRIPDHWISHFFQSIGIPIVTTSVNVSGEKYMTSISDLDKRVRSHVDFMIYDGSIHGVPSKIMDLTDGIPIALRDFEDGQQKLL
ncbi:MAG: threonylcarbamoyl-AMP synthase [Candidatus Aenigmarchaeota archaeon]|nr:threonylcarbamoyl-AMP synthase [Candidatus Aenigmarchaeota archaeon]